MLKVPSDEVLRTTCRSCVFSHFIRNEGGEERLLGNESFILSSCLFKLLISQELNRAFPFITVVRNLGSAKSLHRNALFFNFSFYIGI